MAESSFTYNVSQTANNKLCPEGLLQEIQRSSITIAVKDVALEGSQFMVTFKEYVDAAQKTVLDGLVEDHPGEEPIDPTWFAQKILTSRGSGFRKTTPCFDALSSAFEFEVTAGRKVMMLTSKVTYNDTIEGMHHVVFEVQRELNLGQPGDPQYYVIEQNYYNTMADLLVENDRPMYLGNNLYRLDFIWPQQEDHDRKPTILLAGDKVRVYLTEDAKHSPEQNAYGLYTPYTVTTDVPTWPDGTLDTRKAAHVCFHCISFKATDSIEGE